MLWFLCYSLFSGRVRTRHGSYNQNFRSIVALVNINQAIFFRGLFWYDMKQVQGVTLKKLKYLNFAF